MTQLTVALVADTYIVDEDKIVCYDNCFVDRKQLQAQKAKAFQYCVSHVYIGVCVCCTVSASVDGTVLTCLYQHSCPDTIILSRRDIPSCLCMRRSKYKSVSFFLLSLPDATHYYASTSESVFWSTLS